MSIRLFALALMQLWLSVVSASTGPIIPSPPQLSSEAYILMDGRTGKVLADHNSGQRLPPASLTKIMTSYIGALQTQNGLINLSDEVPISVKAWRMKGSLMFVQEGTKVRLEDLMRGIIIQSGNDASVALAEHIAGSEDVFADLMNKHALRLGMRNTNFVNATGWPHEDHYTSAKDLAILTQELIGRFPEHYKIYSEKTFTFNDISQRNRNTLLFSDQTVDGVKTGHTEAAGYCLVSSSSRDGMRLISVVMGAASKAIRAQESQKLLAYGFRYYDTVELHRANESIRKARVWNGMHNALNLGVTEDLLVTVPDGVVGNLSADLLINSEIRAPILEGQELGKLSVLLDEEEILTVPLVALNAVEEAGLLKRFLDSIRLFFVKFFGGDPLRAE